MNIPELLCLVEGDSQVFSVVAAANRQILLLKELIFQECKNSAPPDLEAKNLILQKVDVDLRAMDIDALFDLRVDGEQMKDWDAVSQYWQEQSAKKRLQVFVQFSGLARLPSECLMPNGR